MKWWQLYFAIKDTWELRKDERFKDIPYEVFLLATFCLEKDFYTYPITRRFKEWGRAVAKVLRFPSDKNANRVKGSLETFYERIKPLLDSKSFGNTPHNIDLLHSFLIEKVGDIEKVYNLELWEVGEIIHATYQIVKLRKSIKENKR
ncbi:MAG: hypothetical protein QXX84_06955 [Sulfolobales archaeon]